MNIVCLFIYLSPFKFLLSVYCRFQKINPVYILMKIFYPSSSSLWYLKFFLGYYVEFFMKGKCKRYFPSYFCALRDHFPAPGPWTTGLGLSLHLLSASEFGGLKSWLGYTEGEKIVNSLPIWWCFEFGSSSVHLHQFTLSLQIVFSCILSKFCSCILFER